MYICILLYIMYIIKFIKTLKYKSLKECFDNSLRGKEQW